ncbi:MAG: DUF1905 domain-containing protein [Thermomicrobiales bacterium]
MQFTAPLVLSGKTATGLPVPESIVHALAGGKRPAVTVAINGFSYRSTIVPMGGEYWIPVSSDVRASAGVSAGEELVVDVELDTEPRTVDVPEDLTVALNGVAGSKIGLRSPFLQQPTSDRTAGDGREDR